MQKQDKYMIVGIGVMVGLTLFITFWNPDVEAIGTWIYEAIN